LPSISDAPAVAFRDVVKTYHRHRVAGLKHTLLHLPQVLRERRVAGEFRALDGVSFEVKRGECFGVCGRNGAGKSTMLGLMARVLRPTSGEVRVEGRVAPLLQLGAGFHPELPGRDNVELNGLLLGLTRREVRERFDAIVEFAELREFIDEPMRTYSSGMWARLGFAVAVHTDPEVLLLDEVLAVGDAPFQEKCRAKMQEFRSRAVTMVLVTHSMPEVARLCDRALLLHASKVERLGTPAEVEERYRALVS